MNSNKTVEDYVTDEIAYHTSKIPTSEKDMIKQEKRVGRSNIGTVVAVIGGAAATIFYLVSGELILSGGYAAFTYGVYTAGTYMKELSQHSLNMTTSIFNYHKTELERYQAILS